MKIKVNNESRFFKVICGSSNSALANSVCSYLGVDPVNVKLGSFSDGENRVEILESVTNFHVFVIQSTCFPVNDNLLELLLIVDALKRSLARSIIVVVPYFGYSRQDRKVASVVPISSKLVANLFATAGVNCIVTMDLHSEQIQGFFDIPIFNLSFFPVVCDYIRNNLAHNDMVFVAPDSGGVSRTRIFSDIFNSTLAVINKIRFKPNEVVPLSLVGKVKDKFAIIQDDMIDTAGTLVESIKMLEKHGVSDVCVFSTHPVLSGLSISRIEDTSIKNVFVSDTIPLSQDAFNCHKIRVLSVAKLFAKFISDYLINL